ncbi:MAG: metallophosphoesterase family protein [Candidatus Promineifilaceae bacterium]
MRILIISDIHANLTAFEAVLADAKDQWDEIWCLGDIIGYGPDPNECVALLREHKHTTLTGNHDYAALGRLDISTFNQDARRAIEWTQNALTDESRTYLEPIEPNDLKGAFTLSHGSPRKPVWEYITDSFIAWENFDHFQTTYCLVGHTHYPVVFEQDEEYGALAYHADYARPLKLDEKRLIINPGSVGQPRDSDPRAAYALLDLERLEWQHKRIPYDIAATQQRMTAHGLPQRLIARLQYGW